MVLAQQDGTPEQQPAQEEAPDQAEVTPAEVTPAEIAPGYATDEDLRQAAQDLFDVILPAAPPTDEVHAAQRDLGAMLFFDPRMSSSGLFSCQSCHNVGMGGVDALPTSVGHGWQKGPRNAPTVYNALFNGAQFWDGRAADLAEQAMGPVQAAVEMNNTPDQVVTTLESMKEYLDAFGEAFPDEAEPVSFANFATAIAEFEETLVTPGAGFDRWLTGDDAAMSDEQKRGLALFMDSGCAGCHNGVNFGGHDYYPFGVVERPGAEVLPEGDRGRFAVTETASDDYVFRAAPLRNVAITAPYFHSGAVWSLPEAVDIMANAQLGTELAEADIGAIVAFLHSLTGEQPRVEHPVLPARTEATPLPNPFDDIMEQSR
ncbi:cytochrome-c peroxidase [Rubellimicrobium rubrum]|uniref:Cytochrome-c peroxidase n=2 Tax=Rubellimicrobium rubrum TaxID=2585369 RepID=A0A5C4MYG9_9RHOB|nr:cytochrome-c peroxidase [Rubellimicrobium rubrum]